MHGLKTIDVVGVRGMVAMHGHDRTLRMLDRITPSNSYVAMPMDEPGDVPSPGFRFHRFERHGIVKTPINDGKRWWSMEEAVLCTGRFQLDIPDTVLTALEGRRVRDLLDSPLFDDAMTIVEAEAGDLRWTFRLSGTSRPIADVVEALAKGVTP